MTTSIDFLYKIIIIYNTVNNKKERKKNMKNLFRIIAVILGFLLIVAAIVIGGWQLMVYNYTIFIACLCFIAGIMFMYLIVNNNTGINRKTPVGWWLSGGLFCAAYSVLTPIWMLWLSEVSWLPYVGLAFVIIASLIWGIGKIVAKR